MSDVSISRHTAGPCTGLAQQAIPTYPFRPLHLSSICAAAFPDESSCFCGRVGALSSLDGLDRFELVVAVDFKFQRVLQ